MRSIKDLPDLVTAIYRDSPQFTVKASFIWSYISLKELFKTKTVYENRMSTFKAVKRVRTGSDQSSKNSLKYKIRVRYICWTKISRLPKNDT